MAVDYKKTIDQALTRKMTRKEFLAQAGALGLSLIGITAILKSLGLKGAQQNSGYGSSAYGGKSIER